MAEASAAAAPEGGTPAAGTPADATPAAAEPVSRPDHIPEKFWDKEKGEANLENWGKSHKELEGKLRTRTDDLTKQVSDEFHAERLKNRPETVDGYEARMPQTWQAPEGVEVKFNDDDPMMGFWRQHCHDHGLGQEGFEAGLQAYVEAQLSMAPDYEAEMAQLGEHGPKRAERVDLWAKSMLSEDNYKALEGFLTKAGGLVAMEEIMHRLGEAPFSPENFGGAGAAGLKTAAELRTMMMDPRYSDANKRDPAYVAEIEQGFNALAKAGLL